MALSRFLPKNEAFFAFFLEAATNAEEAARLLGTVLGGDGSTRDRDVRRLRDLEHLGDDISHRIYHALNSTFVTPLDRDDIQALTTTIDDFVDGIEEVGKRFVLYRLPEASTIARKFAQLLVEQGAAIRTAIPLVEHAAKNAVALRRHVLELHRLENEADDLLTNALAALYDGVTDVPGIIHSLRWGELYQMLEDATDCGEDVADVFEGILITYA